MTSVLKSKLPRSMSTHPPWSKPVSKALRKRSWSMSLRSVMWKTVAPVYVMKVEVLPDGSMTKGQRPSAARRPPMSFISTSAMPLIFIVRLNPLAKLRRSGKGASASSTSSSCSSSFRGSFRPYSESNFLVNCVLRKGLKGPSWMRASPLLISTLLPTSSSPSPSPSPAPWAKVKSSLASSSLVRWSRSVARSSAESTFTSSL
mmetsp:Transcript_70323/g.155494  ORF Transcript_70323/g.155494 Transcript_70323/m.155494 type:complete len:203 (+) Transcript_70323:384-992(+)